MKIKNNLLSGFAVLLLFACDASEQQTEIAIECKPADMVIYNTTIYTANVDQWTAEAVATLGNKIIYVGDNIGAAAFMLSLIHI